MLGANDGFDPIAKAWSARLRFFSIATIIEASTQPSFATSTLTLARAQWNTTLAGRLSGET